MLHALLQLASINCTAFHKTVPQRLRAGLTQVTGMKSCSEAKSLNYRYRKHAWGTLAQLDRYTLNKAQDYTCAYENVSL